MGLISFISGIISLLIVPILFGVAAIILSAISLVKFSNEPGKYKGKGWAIVGLILGIISLVYGVVVLVSSI